MNKRNIPKGFHYFDGDYVKDKNYVIQKFIDSINSLYFNIIEFPPLGFSETFLKGSDITGDKVYEFKDKSERHIMLTPDSQAHALNYYLSGGDIGKNLRCSWISPTFRYRNIPSRYFHQLGYSSINYSQEDSIFELYSLLKQMVNFINNFTNIKINIKIVNPGLIKEIIKKATSDILGNEIYENIRNLNKLDQLTHIINFLPDSKYKIDLINIINGEYNSINDNNLLEYKEFLNIKVLINLLDDIVNINLNIDNLYCSEILSGIGFIIEVGDNKVGDGGIYDIYANRYDKNIKTFSSVCTGINPMIRLLKSNVELYNDKSIIFLIDDYYILKNGSIDLLYRFLEYGFKVDIRKKGKNNKKYILDNSWVFYLDNINFEEISGYLLNKELNFSSKIENIKFDDLIKRINEFSI